MKLAFGLLITLLLATCQRIFAKDSKKPLRVLLITGGCCHNYPYQTQALKDGLAKLSNATWTVVNEGGKGTQATIGLYDNPKWAKQYDVVIHNECFADTKSPDYIKKITKAHYKGVPAVVIHCAMHTYRSAEIDDWRQFLGVTSVKHDHQSRYPVKKTEPTHPIMKDVPDNWITPNKEELYIIEKIWPNTKVLATSVSEVDKKSYPVVWTNKYGKAKVFGISYGHSDEVFADPVYINLVSKGILWAAGRLK
jgi:type 1 glutamine amidotransferase